MALQLPRLPGLLALVGAGVLLIAVSKMATVENPRPSSVGEVATSNKQLENIQIVGKLVGKKPSKSQRGWILHVQAGNGSECEVYLTDDVPDQPMGLGDKFQFIGSTIGRGMLGVSRPDGVKALPKDGASIEVHNVEVFRGIGSWMSGNYIQRCQAQAIDGFYEVMHLEVDPSGASTLIE